MHIPLLLITYRLTYSNVRYLFVQKLNVSILLAVQLETLDLNTPKIWDNQEKM